MFEKINNFKNAYYYNDNIKKVKLFIRKIYSAFFKFVFIFKRKKYKIDKIEKILFISLFFKGDLLYHTPLLNILKLLFPSAKINVWVKSRSADILYNNPNVNEIVIFDDIKTAEYNEITNFNLKGKLKLLRSIRGKKYDLIIDFTGLYKTALYVLFSGTKNSFGRNLQGFGFCYTKFDDTNTFIQEGHLINKYFNILKKGLLVTESDWNNILKIVKPKPQIFLNEDIKRVVNEEFNKFDFNTNNHKLITIHIGAGWDAKKWNINNYEILINKLLSLDEFSIAIVGDDSDKKLFDEIKVNITANSDFNFFSLTFLGTAEIIKRSDLFIGSDSGPLHLAFAVDTPSIALFGPTNPEFSKPLGDIHHVIYNQLICSAKVNQQYCSRNAGKSCPNIVCMKMITVEDVYNEIKLILNKY